MRLRRIGNKILRRSRISLGNWSFTLKSVPFSSLPRLFTCSFCLKYPNLATIGQKSTFNRNAWLRHEEAVVEDFKSCVKEAYVVTGVVPDTNLTINKRVTVSKYYWRATCCLEGDQYIGKGYYGPDNNDKVQELTIAELEKKLQEFYSVPISIFPVQHYQPPRKRPRT